MAPIKEETVHLDPGLWIYHDIVSPKEKQDIIKTAGPFVSHFFRLPSPLRLTQFYRIKLVSQEFSCSLLHCRDAICQFLFRWIYYCHSNKSTGKETGKTHLCALHGSDESEPSSRIFGSARDLFHFSPKSKIGRKRA